MSVPVDLHERLGPARARAVHDEDWPLVGDLSKVRRGGWFLPGVIQRPCLTNGIDRLVECCPATERYVHPRRRMEDEARFARRQVTAQPRTYLDRVAGDDGRWIGRQAGQGSIE